MSTGAKLSNQSNTDQKGGGNLTGKTPSARRYTVPAFQGRSGKADNTEANRKSGK